MKISLEDFKILCNELYKQRGVVEEYKERLAEQQNVFDDLKSQVIMYLNENNLDKFVTDDVTISKVDKLNVSMTDKNVFFKYLKEKGLFESMATINYNTLNSYYKNELENAVKEGRLDFKIPGVEEASVFTNVSIRKRS